MAEEYMIELILSMYIWEGGILHLLDQLLVLYVPRELSSMQGKAVFPRLLG